MAGTSSCGPLDAGVVRVAEICGPHLPMKFLELVPPCIARGEQGPRAFARNRWIAGARAITSGCALKTIITLMGVARNPLRDSVVLAVLLGFWYSRPGSYQLQARPDRLLWIVQRSAICFYAMSKGSA